MSRLRTSAFIAAIVFVLAAVALGAAPPSRACRFTAGPARPLFRGITAETVRITCPPAKPAAAPLRSTAWVVRVDLTAPGLSFESSSGVSGDHFNLELPTSFLARTHSQVAVNANLFTHCCSYTAPAHPAVELLGLEISHGHIYTPYHSNPQHLPAVFPFTASLAVTGRRVAIINTRPAAGVTTAVTGSHLLVWHGRNVAPGRPIPAKYREFFGPNARTLAGLSPGNKVLWLAAVDRNKTSAGVTLSQAAQLMLHLGAASALNLDGGGSTSLAVEGPGGHPRLVNSPGDAAPHCTFRQGLGCERYVGASFAIHAQPLPRR